MEVQSAPHEGSTFRVTLPPIADSGVNVKTFRGEDEQDSGLKANSDSGGKANGFRTIPEWFSRCPE